jgi:hypothetical protein
MTHYFEPVKGAGNERRDELGNTAPYRSQPHRGCDWGFSNGSEGKDIWAIHTGKVTKVWDDPALGWSAIVQNVCDDSCGQNGKHIEYNHMLAKPALKVGQTVEANKNTIGLIGATGSSLSQSGAFHLHASQSIDSIPHAAPREKLGDLFKLIDKSFKQRADIRKKAKEAQ